MKIVLTGVEKGLADGEQKAFEKAAISIGRDASDCDIIFPNDRFPMVSRHHAAITHEAESWVLTDHNSSYGTFLNGQRITRSRLSVGDVMQFGPNGPSMSVVSVEDRPANVSGGISENAPAEVRFPDNPLQQAIAIGQAEITFGRDPQSTVPFPANDRIVSRNHAAIVRAEGGFVLEDRGSFNGTFLNDQRITAPTPLTHGDKVRFGTGGPTAEFFAPSQHSSFEHSLANERVAHLTQNAAEFQHFVGEGKTIVARLGQPVGISKNSVEPQLLMSVVFGEKHELVIGRSATSDIRLDGLDISSRHARLRVSGGQISVEDLGSTNGVYLNGTPITSSPFSPSDSVQIGQFLIKIDAAGTIGVFDTRARMRIDASHLARSVRSKGGRSQLLDDISLTVQPNEFVGIIGPSGSGKTSLMHTLSGASRPEAGSVRVNGRDLYRELASLKHSIGLVPQDDIIHRELTVYRTLLYVAKLRLSRDVSRAEIDRTINEVLDVTGLLPRRDVRVADLSGGQRKRVSVAVELITRPSLLFLDEPTSGLDPQTEFSMMELFRQIADSGRTVVITSHAAETVRMYDKIAVLMQGRLVYFGPPDRALKAFGVSSVIELFARLESGDNGSLDAVAERYRQAYLASADFREYVAEPQSQAAADADSGRRAKRTRLGVFGSIRQWVILSRRYFEVLLRDKLNLAILIAEAPIVAFLTLAAVNPKGPRDFIYFMLSIVAIWFGTSIAAREIVAERPIYKRERMVNLGILPYAASKFTVLGLLVAVQCILLFLPLKIADILLPGTMPGEFFGVPQFWAVLLSAAVGLAIGLLISAVVRSSQMATTLVPLVLIPQILLSGIFGVPNNVSRPLSMAVPAAWSYDTMKRFSTLSTLEPEGASPGDSTYGRGLYKEIEEENDAILTKARHDLEEYQSKTETKLRKYDDDRNAGLSPPRPDLDEMPAIPNAKKVPDDLSPYVTFLHPWMNEVLNQLVLMLMFGVLAFTTLLVLRIKDIR